MKRNINWTEDGFTKCPFYYRHSGGVIACESPVEYDGVGTSLYVTPTGSRKDYMNKYCRGQWNACPIARDIQRKYDDYA